MMDEVTAVCEVKLSFVVSVSVGPKNALAGGKLKEALLRQVQEHLDAAGGLQPEHLDSHSIIELRDSCNDLLLLGA